LNFSNLLSYTKAVAGIVHGGRAFGGPLMVSLSLTNRCNIRCIHCYFYSPHGEHPNYNLLRLARQTDCELPDNNYIAEQQKLDMDLKRAETLIDEIVKMGTCQIRLVGKGEVFVNKNAIDLMARIKHSGCRCHTYTNGILLNTDMIDELIKMKFDEIRFSVMAGTDEMYLRTHPGVKDNTFYNLKQNLLYLSRRKRELGVKYPEVSLVYIVIGENYNGLFEFAEFADLVKADRVFFNPFDDVGDPGLMKLAPTKEQSDFVKKEILLVKDYLEARKIKHNILNFLNVFREQLNTTELYKLIPCYYGWLAALIDPDGVVNPCCRCYSSPGNIYKKSFKDIWYSPSYNQFRKMSSVINVTHTFPEGCDCNSCANHAANLRAYKLLNPLKGNSRQIKLLSSNLSSVD